jgi:hypothetical protein
MPSQPLDTGKLTTMGSKPGVGLEGLGPWLDERHEERVVEDNRRKSLIKLWEQIQPMVKDAVERVNAKLGAHSEYQLLLYEPNFFGRDYSGYGTEAKLLGGEVVGYDTIPFVVTKEAFYVAGLHHWGEGLAMPLDRVTAEVVVDTVADAVKSMICP